MRMQIQSDHIGEFQNMEFDNFCNDNDIKHVFYASRSPKKIRVVE